MKRIIFTLIAVILGMALSFAQVQKPKYLGTVSGAIYGYMEHVPDPAPKKLLISVHGWGERGNGKVGELERVLRVGVAREIVKGNNLWKDFIVISPQYPTTSTGLYAPNFHKFVLLMCKMYGVDSTEVYMAGISGGANSVCSYITSYYHVKRAMVVAGTGNPVNAHKAINTVLLAYHGTKDETIPYANAQNFIDKYNAANPKVKAVLRPVWLWKHEPVVWDRAFADPGTYKFFLGQ
jgi:predicted esterase